MTTPTTILQAVDDYIQLLQESRSERTARTYHNALLSFMETLKDHEIDPGKVSPANIEEIAIAWFAADLKNYASATERLYLTAAATFFDYLVAESLSTANLAKIRLLIRRRARKPGQRLPQFPADDIDTIINYSINMINTQTTNDAEKLRILRDRAFLITLADTGLRVHEACGLHRGSVDWKEGRAVVIGKGDKQDIVRFSRRSIQAIKVYLNARSVLDGTSGKPLGSLPLFARHDKGAGNKIQAITTTAGRNIVKNWVKIILGSEAVGTITPHSFRHYFVTRVLQGSGNLKLAQELARHKSIAVTQRYAHLSNDELDQGYHEIFEG